MTKSSFPMPHMDVANMLAQTLMLAFEAQQVIALRVTKMFSGGPDVQDEAHLMVSEKLATLAESGHMIAQAAMEGVHNLHADQVIQLYRSKVRANYRRLSAVTI